MDKKFVIHHDRIFVVKEYQKDSPYPQCIKWKGSRGETICSTQFDTFDKEIDALDELTDRAYRNYEYCKRYVYQDQQTA